VIADDLYSTLKSDVPDASSVAAARSQIQAILTKYSANNPTAIPKIKAALQAKVGSVASKAAATATGACYYQVGGAGFYCSDGVTQAACALLGGYFTPGQSCMVMVYQALSAVGLLDPPPLPPTASPALPGAIKIP
jgi:hypothetical protein